MTRLEPAELKHLVPGGVVDRIHVEAAAMASTRARMRPYELWPDAHMSPYPVYVPPARILEQFALFAALHPTLVAMVRNWWSRPDWNEVIPMSPKMESVLRKIDTVRPFEHIGSIRPDYIIPEAAEDSLRICEINARFIFNGFFHVMFHDDVVEKRGGLGEWQRTSVSGDEMFKVFEELADPTKPITIVAGSEVTHHSWPFGMGPYLWSHPTARIVNPLELGVDSDGNLTAHGKVLESVLLQMHQKELEGLSEEVLVALGKVCYNDLRTIYIIHDKRLLGLIRNELPWLVSTGVLNPHHAAVLDRGLAETYHPGSPKFTENPDDNKAGWILKFFSSGKGDGSLIGSDTSREEWAAAWKGGKHLLQRFHPSRIAHLLVPSEDGGAFVDWHSVGTMMIINRHLVGMTCFRSSCSKVTALSNGGTSLVGATARGMPRRLTLPPSPLPLFTPSPSSIIQVPSDLTLNGPYLSTVRTALATHGLAVLRLPAHNLDPTSSHLVTVSDALGTSLAHSACEGALWDITPSLSTGARSHSADVFPWHTDCSFEANPPRYFGLHIVRPDRFQGGTLRLVSVSAVLSALSPKTLATLQLPHFRFAVPEEFHKGTAEMVGRVVTADGRMRWRREIISGVNEPAQAALEEVDGLLETLDGCAIGPTEMRAGTILCIDNARWLHARSTVNDLERLLRRVRWGPEEF